MERRVLLKGLAAGAVATVVGYSPSAGAWVTSAGRRPIGDFDRLPHLDGELLTDAATREQFGQDLGFIVFHAPRAVLRPASIEDVAKMIRYCRKHGIKVAARGQGHSTHGQSQVVDGLVIEMATLSAIREIGDGYAIVGAGATWRNLLEATVQQGQTPPVLTGYLGLSIGGTLSMGGISGMAYNKGVQVEHVLELRVVTGEGRIKTCSRVENRTLYDAVLAGIGQSAIIVEVKVELVPAESRTLDLVVRYTDATVFMNDMRTLVMREEFDMIWGGMQFGDAGPIYELFAASFYTPPVAPDIDFMLRDLSFDPGTRVEIDDTYLGFQTRVDGLVEFLRSLGAFDGFMHPWFDVFLPAPQVPSYVESILPGLAPDDVGAFGFVLFFPLKSSTIRQPLFRIPDGELVVLFDILTSANFPGFDAAYAQRMRERNVVWYEAARAVGGTRYPIGTLDFTEDDWRQHYGAEWLRVVLSKAAFDPDHILTPGPGIFPD